MPRDPQVVFHGINKSGSLALADVLRASFFNELRANEFFSHYHHCPAKLDDLIRILECSRGPGFFVGHYLYGAFQPFVPGRILFTQFRHPLPRVVSCYQWLRNKHTSRHGSRDGFPSLDDFVLSTNGKKHSQIVQFGIGFGGTPEERARAVKRAHAKDLFEGAIEAIHRDVALIGIAEYFEETIFLLAYTCGLRQVPTWQRDDRNVGRPLVQDLSQSTADRIREVYAYDFKLYEWAKARFFDQFNNVRFGLSLEKYKTACQEAYKDRIL